MFQISPHLHVHAQNRSNSSASSPSVVKNCPKIQGNDTLSFGCAFFSFGMTYPYDNLSNCSAEFYTGSVCCKQLGSWLECTVGNVQDVILLDLRNSEQSQEERERDAAQFLHYLGELSGHYIQNSTCK